MGIWEKLSKFLLLRLQKGKLEKVFEEHLVGSRTQNQIITSPNVFYL